MTSPLTSWYPPHIKPVRFGFYITRPAILRISMSAQESTWEYLPSLCGWDGKWFGAAGVPRLQEREWRGLSSDPEGQP